MVRRKKAQRSLDAYINPATPSLPSPKLLHQPLQKMPEPPDLQPTEIPPLPLHLLRQKISDPSHLQPTEVSYPCPLQQQEMVQFPYLQPTTNANLVAKSPDIMTDIVVGIENEHFLVHDHLLRANAGLFGSVPYPDPNGPITCWTFPHMDPGVFAMYRSWLYNQPIEMAKSHNEEEDGTFLWKCWCLGYNIQDIFFQNNMMKMLIPYYDTTGRIPTLEDVQLVYATTTDDCPGRRLLTDLWARNMTVDQIESLAPYPLQFVCDLYHCDVFKERQTLREGVMAWLDGDKVPHGGLRADSVMQDDNKGTSGIPGHDEWFFNPAADEEKGFSAHGADIDPNNLFSVLEGMGIDIPSPVPVDCEFDADKRNSSVPEGDNMTVNDY